MVLGVYVDDFKMAGPENDLKKAWPLIRSVIAMDAPTHLGKYLEHGHENIKTVSPDIIKASVRRPPLLPPQVCTTNGCAGGDSQRHVV